MPPIPHSLSPVLQAYAGPLAAFVLALLGALLCRGKARQGWVPAMAAGAALVSWALLLPAAGVLRAALSPRSGPEMLLMPAGASVLAMSVWPAGRGWLGRAVLVLLAVFAGWWLAQTPAGRVEFWRVGFAITVLALAFPWLLAARPARGLACGLALWGGLVVAGAAPGWIGAALAGAAVWAGLLAAGQGAALPASAMAALVGGADLVAGRLVRGGLDGADLACVGALAAPLVAGSVQGRIGKRAGPAGPVAAAAVGAACGVAGAWVLGRVLRH